MNLPKKEHITEKKRGFNTYFYGMNLQGNHTPNMYRANIRLGLEVDVVLKKDQRTGKRTRGKVKWILTSAAFHSRGIKVMLDNRQVGRVQEIIS